jgi:hypothetical protein
MREFDYSLVLVLAVAYLMILAGIDRHALERRRMTRICPACGRREDNCGCRR